VEVVDVKLIPKNESGIPVNEPRKTWDRI